MFWNLFMGFLQNRSQGACLYGVDSGVVPITIQTRDFSVSVVANDVSVRDTSNLSFLYEACDIRRHRPTEQCLHDDSVLFTRDHLDYFDPKIRYGLRKAAPDFFKTTTDRHDAVLAVGKVTSLCAVSAKSQHAVNVMSVVGGKKSLGDRFHIGIAAQGASSKAAAGYSAGYTMVRTIRKRALPVIIRAYASAARSSGMVSTMAATSLIALNLSVASPARGVPVRAPSTPSCLKRSSNADTSIGSSVAPSEITTPPRRRPPRAAATALPPDAVASTTCAPPSFCSSFATSAAELFK